MNSINTSQSDSNIIPQELNYVINFRNSNGLNDKEIEELFERIAKHIDAEVLFTKMRKARAAEFIDKARAAMQGMSHTLPVRTYLSRNLKTVLEKAINNPSAFPVLQERAKKAGSITNLFSKPHGGIYIVHKASNTTFVLSDVVMSREPVRVDSNGDAIHRYEFEFSALNDGFAPTMQRVYGEQLHELIKIISMYGNFGVPQFFYERKRRDEGLKMEVSNIQSIPLENIEVFGNVVAFEGYHFSRQGDFWKTISAHQEPVKPTSFSSREVASVNDTCDDEDDWGTTELNTSIPKSVGYTRTRSSVVQPVPVQF